jgi:hypothetical protein
MALVCRIPPNLTKSVRSSARGSSNVCERSLAGDMRTAERRGEEVYENWIIFSYCEKRSLSCEKRVFRCGRGNRSRDITACIISSSLRSIPSSTKEQSAGAECRSSTLHRFLFCRLAVAMRLLSWCYIRSNAFASASVMTTPLTMTNEVMIDDLLIFVRFSLR